LNGITGLVGFAADQHFRLMIECRQLMLTFVVIITTTTTTTSSSSNGISIIRDSSNINNKRSE